LETECEARVQELQADITALRKELDIVQETSRLAEKEKAMLIAQLTEQNQRLTVEIKQVCEPQLTH
jgi:capsule polysaccharide export protein KpsE/RkpR